ncbi:hypothetical protein ACU8NW_23020 [Rhizobium leguminosarum]
MRTSEPAEVSEHDAEKCQRFSDDIMLYLFPGKNHGGKGGARRRRHKAKVFI